MNGAWRELAEEISRARDLGRSVEFWWRDDDTAGPAPALDRLLALSADAGVPVALAVVPLSADPAWRAQFGAQVSVLQHGADHANRAAPGEKKTEFSASEAPQAALARLVAARKRLEAQAADRFVPVLAPPWNRLPQQLVPRLAGAGFRGLSQYGQRPSAEPSRGLRQVNTHVDIIAWRSGRGFVGEPEALRAASRHLAAKRAGSADPDEATGWLTHHACHDEPAWRFLERLFETTRGMQAVGWRSAKALFNI